MRKEYQKPVAEWVSFQSKEALNGDDMNTSDMGGGGVGGGGRPGTKSASSYNFDGVDKEY